MISSGGGAGELKLKPAYGRKMNIKTSWAERINEMPLTQ